ncbi:hypothetical protein BDK88_0097 [Natrinema hispanicum]|uniref:Uncharacterized protein n=1 Tax=Natrinema hispanicum TaxID=392421 RepID=A0A482YFR2_9EURY|nr:hypothetical protein [Natrinema hispanicum]RZV12558.1 hypothetical protein BDK88_0097 [Natrinema hispanicum]
MDELIEDTKAATRQVSNYIEEYEMFLSWLQEATDTYKEYGSSERLALAETFTQFEQYTKNPVPPREIVRVHREMQEVFREPLLQGILDYIARIESELELSFKDSVRNIFKNELESWERSELIDARDAYDEILTLLDDCRDAEQDHVKSIISQKPQQLLEPCGKIIPQIEATRRTGTRLWEIGEILYGYGWLELEQQDIGPFPAEWTNHKVPEADDVEPVLSEIDASLQVLFACDVPAAMPAEERVYEIINTPQDSLAASLQELGAELKEAAHMVTPLEEIDELRNVIPEEDAAIFGVGLLEEVSDGLTEITPDDVEEVIEDVHDLREQYDDWRTTVITRWDMYSTAIRVLTEDTSLGEPDVLRKTDAFADLIAEDPIAAVQDLDKLVTSLEEGRQTVGDEGGLPEESIQLLFDLIKQQGVSYTAYENAAIDSLSDVINLQVRIDE